VRSKSDLLVATHTPALGSGRALRTYGLARALALGGGLELLYARFGAQEPDAAFRAIPGIELHEVLPSRGARRLLAYGAARASGVPDAFARGVSPELARAARSLAAEPRRRRVIADGPTAAAALAGLARVHPVIYNAHNLESSFRHDLDARGLGSPRALRAFERRLLARSAESWMVSESDLLAARELCPGARLRYVPNVVDVTAIAPVSASAGERRAVFVADFAYEPNRNGLHFLLEEVFPRVWRELPDARLALVGAGLDRPVSTDARVEALGFVPDLARAYEHASCALAPLLQGGGTPLKLIEALAYGLPVIATPRAVAGLKVRDGEHCLIAGGAAEFAAALVGVLRENGARELGSRGRELVAERYSIEALSRILAEEPLGRDALAE
jgi:glycosyltransferase involved in cell wall biosynthesis